MRITGRVIFFTCPLGFVTLGSVALAAEGKAEGRLVLDGKPVKLAYADAFAQPGFFDKNTEDTRVLLTDVPLAGEALEDDFTRINLVNQGRLHSLEVTINNHP